MSLSPSSGWSYYREIIISDTGNVSADFQLRIRLYKDDSSHDNPSNGELDLQNKCSDFPNDIRFGTTNDPSTATQLAQWYESETSSYVDVWVKLPSDGSDTIYLFVGNSSASKYSSGSDTWIFYEEWTSDYTSEYTDLQRANGNQDWGHFRSGTGVSIPYRQLTRIKVDTWDYGGFGSDAGQGTADDMSNWSPSSCVYTTWSCDTDNGAAVSTMAWRLTSKVDGTLYTSGWKTFYFSTNTWYKNEILVDSSEANAYVYSDDYSSILTSGSVTTIPTSTGDYNYYQEYTADSGSSITHNWEYDSTDECISYGGHRGTNSEIDLHSPWTCIGKYASTPPTWSSYGTWSEIEEGPTPFSFKICFNSGSADVVTLTKENKINFIQINDSNESYYKDAVVSIYDLGNNEDKIDLNSTVKIWIENSLEFDGYVARIQKSILGTRLLNLQCIGKTYDLWRYSTSSSTTYENKKSAYIVSSLVATYTPITPPDVSSDDGAFVKYIDLSNMKVGDAIARLSRFDGYHFYVDTSDKLRYYQPASSVQFTIDESDIIDMTPIEHSDDYLRNDILVIGSLEYEKTEPSTLPTYKSGQIIYISTSTTYVAQKIEAPTTLTNTRLSSIKLLVKRSTADNTPYYLLGELRYDNNGQPSSAVVPSSDSMIWRGTDVLYDVSGNWLPYYSYTSPNLELTSGQTYWLTFYYDGATASKHWILTYHKVSSSADDLTSDPSLSGTWDYNNVDFGKVEWTT